MSPLIALLHNNTPACFILLINPHGQNLFARVHVQHFVDFVLDWQAVAVPAEPPLDLVVGLVRPAAHHVLDGARQDVPLVRRAGCERWSILKCEFLFTFRLFQLLF